MVAKNTPKFKTLDLFAGVGGIRLGFETAFANDFDEHCGLTYDLNFEEPKLTAGDIWKVDIKTLLEFDVLLRGFP